MPTAGDTGFDPAGAPPSPVLPDFCGPDEPAAVVLALRSWVTAADRS